MITATPKFRQVKAESCTDIIISVFDPQPFHLFSLHSWGKKSPHPPPPKEEVISGQTEALT